MRHEGRAVFRLLGWIEGAGVLMCWCVGAERSFERAQGLSPRDPWLALELAYVYWPTRQYAKAIEA